ncbi:MAG: hypothetical protein GX443_08505 [Deltaproteobacteria bacterium]|nr:hypothetical protein [Deltaproteobacteria bacterium]
MGLTDQIKRERAGKKFRRPFVPSLFTIVAGIVQRYGLDQNFPRKLDNLAGLPTTSLFPTKESLFKPPRAHALFALVTEREYRIAEAILQRIRNPYLQFARSPDEILACNPLFTLNPSLDAERLLNHHFMYLLTQELQRRGTQPPTA